MAIRQFLLNPDGSIPEGTNVGILEAEGIPMVIPVSPPDAPYGTILVELEPEERDGKWYQRWSVEPDPTVSTDQ